MNSFQRELAKLTLEEEKRILKELEEQYKQAMKDIEAKINQLLARTDVENLQTIIYQLKYQKALQGQIGAILDNLQANQYTSIVDYLKNCYEDGFIGVMYDLQKQGIPIITPLNQEQMVQALMIDSKIKDDLYTSLGHDINELKKEIRREVSRGIANNYSYDKISQLINIRGDIYCNKSFRIARTEGHRVTEASKHYAQLDAKEAGAEIVKQWDATLDRRTRRTHTELDGQIQEVDKPFIYGSHKAMFPGDFGVASLDINCRCAMLQRATWALDEEELETLKTRAAYYKLDKTKDFNDFKKKYLGITEDGSKVFDINSNSIPKVNSLFMNRADNSISKIVEVHKYNGRVVIKREDGKTFTLRNTF